MDGAHGGDGMGRQRDIEEGFWECCEGENKNTLCARQLLTKSPGRYDRIQSKQAKIADSTN